MREELFDYYYAEGGKEAVSDDEMVKYLDDNYLRYKSISFAKTKASTDSSSSATDSSTDSADAANEEAKAKRDEFLEKAQGVSFDDFDSIIDEYNDYVASKKAKDSSSAADSDSSAADSSTSSDDTSSVSDIDTSSTASDDTSSVSDSTAESSSTVDSDSSTDSSSSEPDPYANEKMMNYGAMDDSQKDTTNGKILKEVSGMSTDVATAYEDDNAYYILIKGDIKDRDTEYAKDNHEDLLKEMKSDEFQEKLTSWVEKLDIKVNNKAIKRYTPKVVYDKQTEYYSKNNNS